MTESKGALGDQRTPRGLQKSNESHVSVRQNRPRVEGRKEEDSFFFKV